MRSVIRAGAVAVLVVACAASSCRGGCGGQPGTRRAAEKALVVIPEGARVVASLDVARLRATRAGQRIGALAARRAEDRAPLEALTAQTGFDPLRQLDRLVAAFPEDSRIRGEF